MVARLSFARRFLLVLSLLVASLLSWATLASAQSQFPPLNGVVADDTQSLNVTTINDAAADLQQLAVNPLVVFVSANIGPNDIADYARRAAQNYGFANGDILDPICWRSWYPWADVRLQLYMETSWLGL